MLGNLFPSSEQRAVTYASVFGAGRMAEPLTHAGVSVSQETALKVNTVYAAVRLIADCVSMLPVAPFYRLNGTRLPFGPRPVWLDTPDPDGGTRQTHLQQVLVSMLIDGNAFVRILRDADTSAPIALSVLAPKRVEPKRGVNGRVYYSVDQGKFTVDAMDMIHIPELAIPGQLRGVSRVDELRESIGLTKALDDFAARFFGNSSVTNGIIEVPGEMDPDQARETLDGFEKWHRGLRKSHRPGLLSGGAKWVKTGVDPDEAQMIQSREFAVLETCRLFKIPPHLLGVVTRGAQSYASVEENNKAFVQFTLLPYITKIEDAYSQKLLPGGAFLKFNVDALLRASLADRYASYAQGTIGGFLSINDVHKAEDLPPVDGGDAYRVPLANVHLGAADIVETDHRVSMATRLVNVGYDPAAVLKALSLPPIPHTGLPSVQLQNATLQAAGTAVSDVYPSGE